jgi:hypothetical protein
LYYDKGNLQIIGKSTQESTIQICKAVPVNQSN